MAKITRQNPFGGAPRLGNAAPGEPVDSPIAQTLGGYSGAPTFNTIMNRGEKQVGSHGTQIFPEVYGGGEPMFRQKNPKSASGSGDGTGVGAVSGSTQHSGGGIP